MRLEDTRPADDVGRVAGLVYVLNRLWTYALTTKADEARYYADEIAEAASRGFITTSITPGGSLHGRLWKLTPEGIAFLFDNAQCLDQEEDAYVQLHSIL